MRRRAKDFDLNKSFVRNQTADSCQKKRKTINKKWAQSQIENEILNRTNVEIFRFRGLMEFNRAERQSQSQNQIKR